MEEWGGCKVEGADDAGGCRYQRGGAGDAILTLADCANIHFPYDVKFPVGLDTFCVANRNVTECAVIEVRAVPFRVTCGGALGLGGKRPWWWAEAEGAVFVRHKDAGVSCREMTTSASAWN